MANASGIAHQGVGDIRRQVARQLDSFGVRLFGHQIEGGFDDLPQIEGHRVEGEFARLDFREIEDVVDNAQEGFPAVLDGERKIALFGGQPAFQQQVAHPDDAVHGRANFMGHAGQEQRFGLIGRFGRRAGFLGFEGSLAQFGVGLGQVRGAERHPVLQFLVGFLQFGLGEFEHPVSAPDHCDPGPRDRQPAQEQPHQPEDTPRVPPGWPLQNPHIRARIHQQFEGGNRLALGFARAHQTDPGHFDVAAGGDGREPTVVGGDQRLKSPLFRLQFEHLTRALELLSQHQRGHAHPPRVVFPAEHPRAREFDGRRQRGRAGLPRQRLREDGRVTARFGQPHHFDLIARFEGRRVAEFGFHGAGVVLHIAHALVGVGYHPGDLRPMRQFGPRVGAQQVGDGLDLAAEGIARRGFLELHIFEAGRLEHEGLDLEGLIVNQPIHPAHRHGGIHPARQRVRRRLPDPHRQLAAFDHQDELVVLGRPHDAAQLNPLALRFAGAQGVPRRVRGFGHGAAPEPPGHAGAEHRRRSPGFHHSLDLEIIAGFHHLVPPPIQDDAPGVILNGFKVLVVVSVGDAAGHHAPDDRGDPSRLVVPAESQDLLGFGQHLGGGRRLGGRHQRRISPRLVKRPRQYGCWPLLVGKSDGFDLGSQRQRPGLGRTDLEARPFGFEDDGFAGFPGHQPAPHFDDPVRGHLNPGVLRLNPAIGGGMQPLGVRIVVEGHLFGFGRGKLAQRGDDFFRVSRELRFGVRGADQLDFRQLDHHFHGGFYPVDLQTIQIEGGRIGEGEFPSLEALLEGFVPARVQSGPSLAPIV